MTKENAIEPENTPADKNILLKDFAEKTLGITMWDKLEEIFEAVQSGKRKILIRSCNGAGKTCALAAICNWKLWTTSDSIILTTASSHTQVKRNLWGEIRKQAKHAELFQAKQITETFIKVTDKHYAIGISPSLPENAQGFHAEKMLIVVDEATGVNRDIITALFGNATGADAQIILAYNPIDTDSFPFEAEHNGDWHQIHISAFDHPNVAAVGQALLLDQRADSAASRTSKSACPTDFAKPGTSKSACPTDLAKPWTSKSACPTDSANPGTSRSACPTIPGAVSPEWIADMLPTWSYEVEEKSNDTFQFDGKHWRKTAEVSARILGEWSRESGDGFIPMHLIMRSVNLEVGRTFLSDREATANSDDSRTDRNVRPTKSLGVDIARSGKDSTVFAFFDGNVQLPFKIMRTKDLVEIAHKIEMYYKEGWKIIALDDTGVGGGVTDILRSNAIPCHPIQFGGKAKGFLKNHRFDIANARAEMYFLLDDELKKKEIKLLDDHKLHQEIAAIRIHHGGDKYLLESKDEIKKRLGRSPDRADATVLARYGLRLEGRGRKTLFR